MVLVFNHIFVIKRKFYAYQSFQLKIVRYREYFNYEKLNTGTYLKRYKIQKRKLVESKSLKLIKKSNATSQSNPDGTSKHSLKTFPIQSNPFIRISATPHLHNQTVFVCVSRCSKNKHINLIMMITTYPLNSFKAFICSRVHTTNRSVGIQVLGSIAAGWPAV